MESLYRVKGKYMYYLGIWWIMNTREKLSKFIYSNVSVIVQHNLAQNWYFITTKCRPRRFTAPNSWWRTAEDDAALASSLFRIYSRNADFSGFFFSLSDTRADGAIFRSRRWPFFAIPYRRWWIKKAAGSVSPACLKGGIYFFVTFVSSGFFVSVPNVNLRQSLDLPGQKSRQT